MQEWKSLISLQYKLYLSPLLGFTSLLLCPEVDYAAALSPLCTTQEKWMVSNMGKDITQVCLYSGLNH